MVDTIDSLYGGGFVFGDKSRRSQQSGVEDLRLVSDSSETGRKSCTAWRELDRTANSWVRRVTVQYWLLCGDHRMSRVQHNRRSSHVRPKIRVLADDGTPSIPTTESVICSSGAMLGRVVILCQWFENDGSQCVVRLSRSKPRVTRVPIIDGRPGCCLTNK